MSEAAARDDRQQLLEAAPPAATLVYKTLQHEGPLRYSALRDACYRADSTTHEAVSWLLEHDLIEKERGVTDLRTSRYTLATPE